MSKQYLKIKDVKASSGVLPKIKKLFELTPHTNQMLMEIQKMSNKKNDNVCGYVTCFGRGKVMLPAIESPTYKSERFGDVPYIEAIGVVDEDEGHLTVFAVNRSLNDDIDFQIETRGFGKCRLSFRTEMISDDLKAENSADSEKVRPIMIHEMRSEGRTFDFRLKKASWNMIRFDLS